MTPSLLLLDVDPLELRDVLRIDLREELLGASIDAICPCHIVCEYLVGQYEAYRAARWLTGTGGWQAIALAELSGAKRVNEYVIDLSHRPGDSLREAVAIVREEFLEDVDRLRAQPRIREYFELAQVPSRFATDYVVGPALRDQMGPGAVRFRGLLKRAFTALHAVGLIGPELFGEDLAHSSILMLMRRALGLPDYATLRFFIADPIGFLASGIVNAGDDRKALHERIADLVGHIDSSMLAVEDFSLREPFPPLRFSDPSRESVAQGMAAPRGVFLPAALIDPPEPVDNPGVPEERKDAEVQGQVGPLVRFATWVADLSVGVKAATVLVPVFFFAMQGVLAAETGTGGTAGAPAGLPAWLSVILQSMGMLAYLGWLGIMVVGHIRRIAQLTGAVETMKVEMKGSVDTLTVKVDRGEEIMEGKFKTLDAKLDGMMGELRAHLQRLDEKLK